MQEPGVLRKLLNARSTKKGFFLEKGRRSRVDVKLGVEFLARPGQKEARERDSRNQGDESIGLGAMKENRTKNIQKKRNKEGKKAIMQCSEERGRNRKEKATFLHISPSHIGVKKKIS